MKMKVNICKKNVPTPEWAQIRLFFSCFFSLIGVFAHFTDMQAAQDNEVVARLYNQYMSTPTKQLYQMGLAFLKEEKMDEAMVCFTIVGNRNPDGMDSEERHYCAYALNNAGGIAQLRNSYSTAFSYYKKAMQVADDPIYQSYNNIAGIYLFYNDYTNAKHFLQQAFDISLKQQDWLALVNAFDNIMFLNWRTDSVEQSAELIRRYQTALGIPHDSLYTRSCSIADGMTALTQHRYAEAADIFRQSYDSLSTVGMKRGNNSLLYTAGTYMAMHDYRQALHYLQLTEKDTRSNRAMYMLMLVQQMMIDCYTKMGDTAAAREMKYQYMELKDSINTADEMGKIKNIEFFHEIDRYEKQVVKLSEEKNARSLMAVISLAALMAVLAVLFYVVRQHRQLKQSNRDIYRMNEELLQQAEQARRQRQIDNERQSTKEGTAAQGGQEFKERLSALADQQAFMERIYRQLDDVDFISQQDLTVERLADAVGSHEKTVSQVINETTGKNFNTLLNEYRIREICKRLTDVEHYGLMTNETIAEGLGYKSRSHFIRTFKKVTGLTPSQYQRIAHEEQ